MADPKPRAALRIETLAALLEQPLEDEAAILDVLVVAMGRGHSHEALWQALHKSAQRDDRLAELAFAYERLARDKKLKALAPASQAAVLAHAGTFSAQVFGDAEGAEGYLERALTLAPGDRVAFDGYERILRDRKDLRRLGELYSSAAPHRGDRAEQLALLRRGAEAVEGDPERALKLHTEILRLEPGDAASRKALEQLYEKTGRLADLAKLLEQGVADAGTPPAPPAAARALRARLIALYAGGLGEIERALPHVEEVLRAEPTHEQARRVGEELLGHKALAARAAAALSAAYEAAEEPVEAARLIAIEIEAARGPKRLEAQKRLARITLEQLGDLDKTFPMYEAIVPLDPTDEDVRSRFVQLASAIDKQLEATRTLTRAASGTRDAALKARIGADLGDLFRELGDTKKARAAYQAVLDARAEAGASLRAARAMAALSREPRDAKGLVAALGQLIEIEPAEEARLEAILELARVAEEELSDVPAATAGYERLLGTKLAKEANRALARLYEAAGKAAALAEVLDRMIAEETDAARAKELSFRVADLRSSELQDRGAALKAWQAYIAKYGASREALARLTPLLEHDKRWDDLVTALREEAALSPREERPAILARLGQVHLAKKNDPRAALDAFAQALAIDPAERQSRAAIERMLATGDLRLEAGRLLEPIVRAEGAAPLLVRVLETTASLGGDASTRLAALAEAAELCHASLRDPKRAVDLAARGLTEALAGAIDEVPAWVERVDKLSAGGDATRRAAALRGALGDRAIDHPAIALVAKRAGEALIQTGDVAGALVVYRATLEYEPSSPELLERVDSLLREQGSPEERLNLYRAALDQATSPERRRELRHAVGVIQRRDLSDPKAALATYREALAEAPDDREALAAVLEIYEAEGAWAELYAELERAHAAAAGDERGALLVRLAELAASRGWIDKAAANYAAILASDGALSDDVLAAAEKAARARDDVTLLRTVLERRIAAAIDPQEESAWLANLAELLRDRLADPSAAVAAFRRAADSAETAGDVARASELLETMLALAPGDRPAAERLLRWYRDAGLWARMPRIYELLLRGSPSPKEAARVLLTFEAHAAKAEATALFVTEADALLARAEELPSDVVSSLRSARARVLAQDPARFTEAVEAYKSILTARAGDETEAATALEGLLASRGPEVIEDRRWLFAHRVEVAVDGERTPALLAWAAAEESALGDPAAATALYERVVAADPENDVALTALSRLHVARGAYGDAAAAIDKRRSLAQGTARAALELELASLLMDHLARPDEAVDVLAGVLEANPADRAALRLVERALAPTDPPIAGPTRRRAAEMLERASESTEDAELATALLDVLLATAPNDPDLAEMRRGFFVRYLDRPGLAPARALEIALTAAAESPDQLAHWERAEQLARTARAPARVARAYRDVLATEGGPLTALPPDAIEEIGRRAVEFHEEWFDQPDTVIELLERTVALAPSSPWAFERLKLTFNLTERWEDLFALYDAAIARATDPDERRDLLEDAALAAKDLASDAPRATAYYEAVYELRPDARVRTALERLYERGGRHRALVDLLEADLAELGPNGDRDAAERLHARIAHLWLEGGASSGETPKPPLGDPLAALSAIERVIAGSSRRDEGLDLLERFLARTGEAADAGEASAALPDATTANARRRAATLLKDRYRVAGRASDLARMLSIEIHGAASREERVGLLRALVRVLLDDLHDEERAFDATAELLELEPGEPAHRAELGRLSDRLGRPERLAKALVSAARRADLGARLDLLAQAAEVYEARLADTASATDAYRQLLAAAVDRPDVALAAARKLDRLLASAGKDADRSELLEQLAGLEPEAEGRRAVRKELARLAFTLGDTERGLRALRAALDEDAGDLDAETRLAAALEGSARWAELASLLERRASRGGVDARADRVRVARILEQSVGDVDGAIAAWTKVREVFGSDDESSDALASLLDRTARIPELTALLEGEAAAAPDEGRAADLWRRVGDLHRERTNNLAEAVAAYDLALESRPLHPGAREGLESVLRSAEGDAGRRTRASVVASLVRLYRAAKDHAALIALLDARLGASATPEDRLAIYIETARLQEHGADDPVGALDATLHGLALAAEVAPATGDAPQAGPEALVAEVKRLADLADGWGLVAKALTGDLGDAVVPAKSFSELSLRVARWHHGRGDLAAGERALTKALAREPASLPLLESLAEIQRGAAGRPLAETLLLLAAARGGDLETRRQAAEVAERAGDAAWTASLAQDLLDAAAADFTASGAQPAAAWAIEALARLSPSPAVRAELFLRGAALPFADRERRRLRLAAAALAEGDAAVALYEELFAEAPADPEAGAGLERIYRRDGRRADLIALRERQIAATPTDPRCVPLRRDLAALRLEAGDRDGAIAALRANLESADDAASMDMLSELYESGGHDAELCALHEERAALAESTFDTKLALSSWTKAASLAEHRLADTARAIAAHRRASALGATASDDELARLLGAIQDHAGAAAVLERICDRIESSPAPGSASALAEAVLRLVDALRAGGSASLARARLERAAKGERAGGPLRQRLALLLREAGEWRALAEHLAEDAGKTTDRVARVALLREAADIHLMRRGDPSSAIPLLEQAAELSEGDALAASVHLRLASARRATGDLEQAAATLRSLLEAYGARRPKERALVHFELAQVDLAKGERARAIGELEAALRIDPAHAEALHVQAKLSLEEGQLERAARTYRALLLVVKRPRADGATWGEVSRAEILFELAEIARLRGEPDRAAEQLESAFEAARESEGERERLVALLRTRGRHDLLARALEKRLAETSYPAEVAAIQEELAGLYEHHLGRIAEALDARLAALSHTDRSPAALAAVLDLARRAGQVERYVAALARFAESERDEDRAIDLHVTLGNALENDLRDDARAASAYRKAEALATAQLVPDVAVLGSLWRGLAGVYGRLGDVGAQEALLERRLAADTSGIEPKELADASYQLAELRLRRPGTAAGALELLDRALSLDPQPERAAGLLRSALAQGADEAATGRALEHIARGASDDRMLVEALVVLSAAERGQPAAIDPLREAVEVATRLGDAALVEDLLRKAVALAGVLGDDLVDWALLALGRRRIDAGDLREGADLRERAARVADTEIGRALFLDVATMAAGPLGDLERAARIYEELRQSDSGEREIWEPLAGVYRRMGDRGRLAALLEQTAPLLEEVEERSKVRLERARLAIEDDQDKAVAVLKEILDDDPAQGEAATMLADLFEKLGRREELAALVRTQLDVAKDREDRAMIVPLSLRLGALLEQQWDEQGALDVYHAALEWEPRSAEVLRQIVRVGMARDDSMSLADALDALLAVEQNDEAVDLSLRLAKIRTDHDDAAGAVAAIEKGWAARPGDTRLRDDLTKRYTESGDWKKLADLKVKDAEMRPAAEERVAGLREAADLLKTRGEDEAGAAEILLRALEVQPENREVLVLLIDSLSATSQHARAVEAIGRAIAVTPDDPWLYRTRASLQAALGRDQAVLLDLEQAYEKSGGDHAAALIEALRRAAAACEVKGTPEARAARRGLRLRLAAVLAQAGDIEEARAELTDLVAGHPEDRTALRALALLEESRGDWAAASAIYGRLVALEDGEALVDTALHLAEACDRGDRLGDAREALERARRIAPDNAAVRQRLRDLYSTTDAGRELGALLLDDASRTDDPNERFGLLMHAGRLLIASDGESDNAAAVFGQARALRPDDPEATLLLADAYTIGGRLGEARLVLDGAVASQRGRRTRALAAVHRRLARLDLAAGDSAAALAALTRAFDNDAQNAHLAMELGTLAVELEEHEPATRAFRAVTLMKTVAGGGNSEAATPALRALAYYHLGRMAFIQGDKRKARLMIDKAVADDPTLDAARALLDQLRTA